MSEPLIPEDLIPDLRRALLNHYDRHGRLLPWRGERDLYRLWVSEIMLQQTGVATVIPYYHRFLERFPTVAALADAPLESVLAQWQGLGYYRRARLLHAGARRIVAEHGGRFPATRADISALPGVGRSTAGALLAIGVGQREAILDGNVKRVLTRLLDLNAPGDTTLWGVADALTDPARPGDYAQAIMDLGATVCLPRQPRCDDCPWVTWCAARARGEVAPAILPRPAKPAFRQEMVVTRRAGDGAYLLRKRPAKGLLAGMWEPPCGPMLPEGEGNPPWGDLEALALLGELGVTGRMVREGGTVRHVFTHLRLTVTVHLCPDAEGEAPGGMRWVGAAALEELPMATLHRKVLEVTRRGSDG